MPTEAIMLITRMGLHRLYLHKIFMQEYFDENMEAFKALQKAGIYAGIML